MLFLIILVLALIGQLFPVWWLVVPIAFISALYLGRSGRQAFWSGFFANALLWATLISMKIIQTNDILLIKISRMFSLPGWPWLVVVAVLIGGMLSGTAAISGYFTRQLLRKPV